MLEVQVAEHLLTYLFYTAAEKSNTSAANTAEAHSHPNIAQLHPLSASLVVASRHKNRHGRT
jgi:hypothetical protein